ncbi:hypothetical protein [Shewanella sp. MBTL60-007]|uniref:hypothetical protein n=1 Tax=Shewanella sp. MBTL60-007 TaxID=2815911 RepID=UPI001BBF48B3|nr:hypothetical protein [Shewanella sp. MBTL60-007]GIU26367.1 hypothetical protein TUM3792_33060 [Shewanella sp. MBTL60-007]
MKELSKQEQDIICGGGVSNVVGGAVGAAVTSGSGSPGCAALGAIAGGAVASVGGSNPITIGGAAAAGTIVGSAVTDACNNRPGYPAGSPSESGMPSGLNRYWPSPFSRGGNLGGGSSWPKSLLPF